MHKLESDAPRHPVGHRTWMLHMLRTWGRIDVRNSFLVFRVHVARFGGNDDRLFPESPVKPPKPTIINGEEEFLRLSFIDKQNVAHTVSSVRLARPHVPVYHLGAHIVPTLWVLYRVLLRASPVRS